MRTIQDIKPYFRQLNRELSNKVKIDTDEKTLNLVLQLI